MKYGFVRLSVFAECADGIVGFAACTRGGAITLRDELADESLAVYRIIYTCFAFFESASLARLDNSPSHLSAFPQGVV